MAFPTICDICGQSTGERSYWTHRTLAHPETAPKMEWREEVKGKRKTKRRR